MYLREISKRKLLTPQAESALAPASSRRPEGAEKLIKANLGLVVKSLANM